ncbi:MAG TPA: protein-glutamate O-methyltransferase CheR [Polyangiaceae bacterium]|nr:protein-glutamate O-methyltransferase CheR [Polyangiaceae bacterium]
MRRFESDARPHLSPDDFRLMRDLVYAHSGLRFEEDASLLFERRLAERVEALGLPSFGAYYKYLRFNQAGAAELEEAVERLTTKETYFFRQEYQLRAFRDELLPMLAQQNRDSKRLAVWSAGCSTGEEAYTIAILIDQSGLFHSWDVRVVGTDISKQCVAHARRGVYKASSFRTTPPEVRARYFREQPDGSHVADEVKKLCHFGNLNLLDHSRAGLVGRVDVVFCRNVLIYFDVQSRRRVIDLFCERLLPGGYLLLGHSESLLNVTTAFELVHLREDLVYRKPPTAERWDRGRNG